MLLIKLLQHRSFKTILVAPVAFLIVAGAYSPSTALAANTNDGGLKASDQVPVEGTYALITTFVGQAIQQGGLVEGGKKNIGNCPGANLAVMTIFKNPDGGIEKITDYYDIESYHALTCEKNDPATDLAVDNAKTSVSDSKVNKGAIEKAIQTSLESQGWKVVDSYVTWSEANHTEGDERALESEDFLVPNAGSLFWGWNPSKLRFFGTLKSSPYARFISVDGGKNDPTDDTSVVIRPIHVQFNRLYDQGCNLKDADVANKDATICTFINQDGSKVTRTLNELIADVRASEAGTFIYGGNTQASAGGTTKIHGCSISEPGSGANQIVWALLAIPALVLLRRKLFFRRA